MSETKAERLFTLFGSQLKLAQATGLNQGSISRWNRMEGPRAGMGIVPAQFNELIREAADREKIDRAAVEECLEPNICPCCRQLLPPGMPVPKVRYGR